MSAGVSTVAVLTLVLALAIPLAVVIGVVVIVVVVINRIGSGGQNNRLRADEARMLQAIHSSLTHMEQRLEALETLMLDRKP